MKAKPHPEQGFRACLGILRLARSYGSARIEAACRRNDIGATARACTRRRPSRPAPQKPGARRASAIEQSR